MTAAIGVAAVLYAIVLAALAPHIGRLLERAGSFYPAANQEEAAASPDETASSLTEGA